MTKGQIREQVSEEYKESFTLLIKTNMKKTYQMPAIKMLRVATENIMGLAAVSGGYEQGVSGDGSDNEARAPLSLF